MSEFTVNDTRADLTGVCSNVPVSGATTAADLTGATVVLHIKRADRTILTKTATITDADSGTWSYRWLTGELNSAGSWWVETQVTYSDGGIQTFGPARFSVRDEIA